ncbi:MAG: triose-phosphate isomerase [Zetaproteobacteria bacterium CG_4_9_14_3_um_filter_49_83]|nr:MAG: triose-phosphate isomerase [Zetaproteobacteria bacterium CG1_02_49_23]PIQ31774.1 MAG: triose-phosphate isomerase [Zetaproteobacteria bacterium CG17_big_fil_post_rev_8_21_14_2_50_50_13]PIV31411.1 MAG: triose-phosphate isomerase [Zetaproteobacteria bacterium CG02_land_8_20_14_3_00_50_9]PIY56645.1 MAG: triose-phosphate isomerase [Zetaproteobacteria bacterium CG_4_10_14_0_8_um_filter_49_80]PJA34200.1 MAG: triose-phosphate isomerase [Zetaproteobacteria bacterium CG_4_9_14_3_um_filter_49_83]
MSGSVRCLIAGNWKMNGLLAESLEFVRQLADNPAPEHVEMALMPPYTLLYSLSAPLADKGVRLGAQSVFYEHGGAFTGSISPEMLRDTGCHYVILGHSERRDIIGEGSELILKKLNASWESGLEPILCIGEHLDEREAGRTNEVLKDQLSVLASVPGDRALTVAYEPVWAIGTGKTATTEQITETHAFVHAELKRLGHDCRVLYGGSVNPANARDILACDGVNGALVGGASLKADSYMALVEAAASVNK